MFSEDSASTLAEQEGLVTHLTSLVLVDEAGSIQEGIPANRKVSLPAPSSSYSPSIRYNKSNPIVDYSMNYSISPSRASRISYDAPNIEREEIAINFEPIFKHSARHIAETLVWDKDPTKLSKGDLSDLSENEIEVINETALLSEIQKLALSLNMTAIVLVIALMAQSQAGMNRSAARIAKSVLGPSLGEEENKCMVLLGLQ